MKIPNELARAYRKTRTEHFPRHSRPRGLSHPSYQRQPAVSALREARISEQFRDLAERGLVRLREEPDDLPASDVIGDLFGDSTGCPGGDRQFAAEKKRLDHQILAEGTTGILSEFWTGKVWREASAVWGFVGQDWKGSGYDTDLKAEAIESLGVFWKSDQSGQH